MISLFQSKNKTRTVSVEEFIDVITQNKDLFRSAGITNIGGINLYHFKNDDGNAQLSYGSLTIVFDRMYRTGTYNGYYVGISTIGTKNDKLQLLFEDEENVGITDNVGTIHKIPMSAFESDIDFFQYTLLNLKYSCTDASLTKLVRFIKEITNE